MACGGRGHCTPDDVQRSAVENDPGDQVDLGHVVHDQNFFERRSAHEMLLPPLLLDQGVETTASARPNSAAGYRSVAAAGWHRWETSAMPLADAGEVGVSSTQGDFFLS